MIGARDDLESGASARAQFDTLATIDGYDVVDERGRAVDHRSTRSSANGVAYMLNRAAAAGPKALASVLNRGPKLT